MEPFVALSLISKAKSTGVPVSDDNNSLIAEVYRNYERELKLLNAVDFDDLLILAERALREKGTLTEVEAEIASWKCK